MNYYAKGGQAHGLKSLTDQKIQTKDGVPSFGIGGSFQRAFMKPVTNAVVGGVKAIQNIPGIKQVSDVSTQAFKPIDQALVGFDKAVGKTIPGGYSTLAQIALSMIPGAQPLAIGLGAASGSGVLRKGGNFNLQGAMIGGATAYASSELGEYLRAAGGAEGASKMATLPESASYVIPGELGDIAVNSQGQLLNSSGQVLNSGTQAASGAINAAPTLANSAPYVSPSTLQDQYVQQGLQEGYQSAFREPSLFDKATSMSTYTKPFEGAGSAIYDAGKSVINAPADAVKAVGNYDYSTALDRAGQGMRDTASGIKSVLTGNANPAAAAAVKAGTTMAPALSTAGTVYGVMSLADLDAQRDFLKQQQASGNIAQAEYDAALAEINRQRDYAASVVKDSPFSINPDRDVSIGETFYGRGGAEDALYGRGNEGSTLYAMGGSVDDESGMDEARGLGLGNLSNGFMNMGSTPSYAKGGEAKESRDYLDMINAELRLPSAQYVEGMGFMTPPPSVGGRLGANFDAIGGNIRAGLSGNAMMDQDRKIMARPEMIDIGYKGKVGRGDLDVGLQRAIQSMPGRNKDYAVNAKYSMKFADGGNVSTEPRFLSGGGDGMSDDIPATINDSQPARLADGEFVVPADVVSHIGNGSSKAGAKQLYSMMNKVRKARTGNPKQGKQINPRKYMPA
jgi:hypothetical protein